MQQKVLQCINIEYQAEVYTDKQGDCREGDPQSLFPLYQKNSILCQQYTCIAKNFGTYFILTFSNFSKQLLFFIVIQLNIMILLTISSWQLHKQYFKVNMYQNHLKVMPMHVLFYLGKQIDKLLYVLKFIYVESILNDSMERRNMLLLTNENLKTFLIKNLFCSNL